MQRRALRALRRSGIPEERAIFSPGTRPRTFRRYDVTVREDNRENMERSTEYRRKRFADSSAADADKAANLLRIPRNG